MTGELKNNLSILIDITNTSFRRVASIAYNIEHLYDHATDKKVVLSESEFSLFVKKNASHLVTHFLKKVHVDLPKTQIIELVNKNPHDETEGKNSDTENFLMYCSKKIKVCITQHTIFVNCYISDVKRDDATIELEFRDFNDDTPTEPPPQPPQLYRHRRMVCISIENFEL
jgi:hypothetical protein